MIKTIYLNDKHNIYRIIDVLFLMLTLSVIISSKPFLILTVLVLIISSEPTRAGWWSQYENIKLHNDYSFYRIVLAIVFRLRIWNKMKLSLKLFLCIQLFMYTEIIFSRQFLKFEQCSLIYLYKLETQ